jgi:hypothetical protein
MSLTSWLRNLRPHGASDSAPASRLLSRHSWSHAAPHAKCRFRPSLERLEERATPTVYNNAAQWSATHDPNGVWSYGYLTPSSTPETPDTSTFTLYTQNVKVAGTPSGFIDDWRIPGSTDPNTIYNPFGHTVSVGTVTWQPHQASFHPGPNGEYSDYRFTTPSAGTYSLNATFTSIDTVGGADKDIHVLVNGSELYDDILSGS